MRVDDIDEIDERDVLVDIDEIDETVRIDDKWYTHTHIEHQKQFVWIDERDELDDVDRNQIELREHLEMLDEKLYTKFDIHHILQTSILWMIQTTKLWKYHEKTQQQFREAHKFERKQLCVIQRQTTQAHQQLERLQFNQQQRINIWRIRIRWLDFQIERHTIFQRLQSTQTTRSLMCKPNQSQLISDENQQQTQNYIFQCKQTLLTILETMFQLQIIEFHWIQQFFQVCEFDILDEARLIDLNFLEFHSEIILQYLGGKKHYQIQIDIEVGLVVLGIDDIAERDFYYDTNGPICIFELDEAIGI